MNDSDKLRKKSAFSRRGFLQGVGATGGALGTGILTQEEAQAQTAKGVITGETPITLTINGKPYKTTVEARNTLLDVLRNNLDLTAAKRVCDRGTCGACTVIMEGKAVYACTVLAIEAQGRKIETLEGLSTGNTRHPLIDAFVNNDAQQCGYCTPGFVMASKAMLDRTPSPTEQQVKEHLGGNLCRCGTYMGIRKAVVEASKQLKGGARA
ncbi:MAG: (2Fe-2S)-binding protein [Bryobacteraceae bacterium]|nr:(2Fe-2S)-binding protein [Bryobacteraceae bacterium]